MTGPLTAGEAMRGAARRLSETSDTARLDAELLMAHALGVTRSDLLLRHTGAAAPDAYEDLITRRAAHEPVAYLLGYQEFYGRAFAVSPDVLIPRSDSEAVVEAALHQLPHMGRVLDLGTGSGALLLTLLAEREESTGAGIDCSAAALHIAAGNAEILGLAGRVAFHRRSWHDAGWQEGLGRFDLVIANPPYVETSADLAPSVNKYEPHGALFAGPDGLNDYRTLIPQFASLLATGGKAVLEIGYRQAAEVTSIAGDAGFTASLHHDLGERPRALVLTMI